MNKLFVISIFMELFFASCKKDPSTAPPMPTKSAPVVAPFVLSVSVYPNSSTGVFTMQTNDTKPDTVQIYDVLGNLKLTQVITGITVFDLVGWQNGVFFVKITSSTNNTYHIQKIIIQ